jgi:chromosome segregation ATPase
MDPRREAVRRQRIESEQKRRDELRDGYARLKSTLPSINQKSSKVTLLDRAASHIKYLDAVRNRLEAQLKAADDEVNRLRNVNEALMLGTANQRHAAAAMAAVNAGMVPTSF